MELARSGRRRTRDLRQGGVLARLHASEVGCHLLGVDLVVGHPAVLRVLLDQVAQQHRDLLAERRAGVRVPLPLLQLRLREAPDAQTRSAQDGHQHGRAVLPDDLLRAADETHLLAEGDVAEVDRLEAVLPEQRLDSRRVPHLPVLRELARQVDARRRTPRIDPLEPRVCPGHEMGEALGVECAPATLAGLPWARAHREVHELRRDPQAAHPHALLSSERDHRSVLAEEDAQRLLMLRRHAFIDEDGDTGEAGLLHECPHLGQELHDPVPEGPRVHAREPDGLRHGAERVPVARFGHQQVLAVADDDRGVHAQVGPACQLAALDVEKGHVPWEEDIGLAGDHDVVEGAGEQGPRALGERLTPRLAEDVRRVRGDGLLADGLGIVMPFGAGMVDERDERKARGPARPLAISHGRHGHRRTLRPETLHQGRLEGRRVVGQLLALAQPGAHGARSVSRPLAHGQGIGRGGRQPGVQDVDSQEGVVRQHRPAATLEEAGQLPYQDGDRDVQEQGPFHARHGLGGVTLRLEPQPAGRLKQRAAGRGCRDIRGLQRAEDVIEAAGLQRGAGHRELGQVVGRLDKGVCDGCPRAGRVCGTCATGGRAHASATPTYRPRPKPTGSKVTRRPTSVMARVYSSWVNSPSSCSSEKCSTPAVLATR